jgi:hypothetical protein
MTFDLAAAIKAAGAAVQVPDGQYGNLSIRQPCHLVGGPGAVFRSINITLPAHDVILEGFSVHLTPDAGTVSTTGGVRFAGSAPTPISGLTLRGLTLTCGPAVTGCAQDAEPGSQTAFGDNVLGLPTGTGVALYWARNVSIEDCDISGFMAGVSMGDCRGVAIRGNHIHDIRTTPIGGSVLGDITISGNRLVHSTPWKFGGKGDHGDAVHLWTDAKQKALGRVMGVTVSGNWIEQFKPLLGIYLDDNGQGIGFGDVDISGNAIMACHAQGMLLENVQGRASGNLLLQIAGDPAHDAVSVRPIAGSVVSLSGNVGHDIYGALAAQPGNTVVPPAVQPAWVVDLARAKFAVPQP